MRQCGARRAALGRLPWQRVALPALQSVGPLASRLDLPSELVQVPVPVVCGEDHPGRDAWFGAASSEGRYCSTLQRADTLKSFRMWTRRMPAKHVSFSSSVLVAEEVGLDRVPACQGTTVAVWMVLDSVPVVWAQVWTAVALAWVVSAPESAF